MKKLLFKVLLALMLPFVALFLYANLRTPTPTESLQSVHLKIYSTGFTPDEQQAKEIAFALKAHPDVTACSVNGAYQTVSVTYHPGEKTEQAIVDILSLQGQFEVKEKVFPPAPVCPVPSLDAMKTRLFQSLKIF